MLNGFGTLSWEGGIGTLWGGFAVLGRPVRFHVHAEFPERGCNNAVVIRCQRGELEGIIKCAFCERPCAESDQRINEAPKRLRQSVLVAHGRVLWLNAANLKLFEINVNATLVETREVRET